jgi:PAS domain S-box-containing protein
MNSPIESNGPAPLCIASGRPAETVDEGEPRFDLTTDNAVDYAILTLDTVGHVVSWSDGAERIKGYKADEIIGKHFSRFYLDRDI